MAPIDIDDLVFLVQSGFLWQQDDSFATTPVFTVDAGQTVTITPNEVEVPTGVGILNV